MTPAFFDKIAKFLVGRKIKAVTLEADCIVLLLDNGFKAHVWRDDEGNGPGALYFTDEKNKGINLWTYEEPRSVGVHVSEVLLADRAARKTKKKGKRS
jgi:hypothetical protein